MAAVIILLALTFGLCVLGNDLYMPNVGTYWFKAILRQRQICLETDKETLSNVQVGDCQSAEFSPHQFWRITNDEYLINYLVPSNPVDYDDPGVVAHNFDVKLLPKRSKITLDYVDNQHVRFRFSGSDKCVDIDGWGVAETKTNAKIWSCVDYSDSGEDHLYEMHAIDSCSKTVGIGDPDIIPNSKLTAISQDPDAPAENGRLHHTGPLGKKGWCSVVSDGMVESWTQVDFGEEISTSGIKIQGTESGNHVLTFAIEFSYDGTTFHELQDYPYSGARKVMTGLQAGDSTDTIVTVSWTPFSARYLKVVVVSQSGSSPCMRFEVLGCSLDANGLFNHAWGQTANQNSVSLSHASSDANKALDGSTGSLGNCAITSTTNEVTWWMLELKEAAWVNGIVITNIQAVNDMVTSPNEGTITLSVTCETSGGSLTPDFDCLNKCNDITQSVLTVGKTTVTCQNPIWGKYVVLHIPAGSDKTLAICEVEVYSPDNYVLRPPDGTCSCPTLTTEAIETTMKSTTLETTVVPTTMETTVVPTTMETTVAPTTMETTVVPTTMETTVAFTTLETTAAPTTMETTVVTTTVETTAVPTTMETTYVPTITETTAVHTTMGTTDIPTTMETTVAFTTLETTAAPTTMETTAVPSTMETTAVPTTMETTVKSDSIASETSLSVEMSSPVTLFSEYPTSTATNDQASSDLPEGTTTDYPSNYLSSASPNLFEAERKAIESGNWWAWTECTRSCDGGIQVRFKLCLQQNQDNCTLFLRMNSNCSVYYNIESRACNIHECPVDGVWYVWSDWSECSVQCGHGTVRRQRLCVGPFNEGRQCEGDPVESSVCKKEPCPYTKSTVKATSDGAYYGNQSEYLEADHRRSAVSLGALGIVLVSVFGAAFVIPDLFTMGQHLKSRLS